MGNWENCGAGDLTSVAPVDIPYVRVFAERHYQACVSDLLRVNDSGGPAVALSDGRGVLVLPDPYDKLYWLKWRVWGDDAFSQARIRCTIVVINGRHSVELQIVAALDRHGLYALVLDWWKVKVKVSRLLCVPTSWVYSYYTADVFSGSEQVSREHIVLCRV